MDAVELPYPVDVAAAAVSKLIMGSDGFVGRAGVGAGGGVVVAAKKVEPRGGGADLDRAAGILPIRPCGAAGDRKDVATPVNALDMPSQHKTTEAENYRHNHLLPDFHSKDVAQDRPRSDVNFVHSPGSEDVRLPWKAGKVPRNNNTSSKRARSTQVEDASAITLADEVKGLTDKSLTRSGSLEKNHSAKQRTVGSKRGDRRNSKAPVKNRYDAFMTRPCSSSFTVSPGGSNFLGFYGLKSDNRDITKLVDDLSLIDILEGTFKCPSLGKEKGKKSANADDKLTQSVRKACSVLQPLRRGQSQNLAEIEICEDKKISSVLSSASLAESGAEGDYRDMYSVDPSSSNEGPCGKPETSVDPLDLPLYTPNDLWERLSLPPPKDLDSLLLDAVKPALSSKSMSDLRSGKQIVRRGCLPLFPWSHAFNGHSRNNSDAAKLSISRNTCQGRWVRVASPVILAANSADCYTDLESITYNEGLVPSVKRKAGILASKIASQECSGIPPYDWASSSSATCSFPSNPTLESLCPSLLAAAQTLCGIASKESGRSSLKWSIKPLQKAPKPRKLKSSKNCEEALVTPKSETKDVTNNLDQILSSKKPKLSNMDICFTKSTMSWSTPRSSRSSPSRSVRDFVAETRHSMTSISKQSSMLPPAARVFDKAYDSHQKPKTSMPLHWSRGRGDGLH
ncbi:uncharacterized protein LOC115692282 isoform X3 [Syzygium oleosum]|uniref:uncharacterized protein LOC115692282 isoform X3 n=1 Tax=Syzygium oleosum TaxID=219896 RepID=UPI0024BB8C05|nr:uncharacterized protein LOC115692282 isoform X3 [Syzygium oleosum]